MGSQGVSVSVHIDATEVEELNFVRRPFCAVQGWLSGRTAEEECPILKDPEDRTESYLYASEATAEQLAEAERGPQFSEGYEMAGKAIEQAKMTPPEPIDLSEEVAALNEKLDNAGQTIKATVDGVHAAAETMQKAPEYHQNAVDATKSAIGGIKTGVEGVQATMAGIQKVAGALSWLAGGDSETAGAAPEETAEAEALFAGEEGPAAEDAAAQIQDASGQSAALSQHEPRPELGQVTLAEPGTLSPVFAANAPSEPQLPHSFQLPAPKPETPVARAGAPAGPG